VRSGSSKNGVFGLCERRGVPVHEGEIKNNVTGPLVSMPYQVRLGLDCGFIDNVHHTGEECERSPAVDKNGKG